MAQNDSKDLAKIQELIEIMKDNELIEVEISHGDDKILLKRSDPNASMISAVPFNQIANSAAGSKAAFEAEASALEDDLVEIPSPIVGTFYSAPSPDSDSFVQAGSSVGPQTVVCVIEAMKVMNEIKAEISGTIAEVLVSNGQAVEYGQPIFKVKAN
ncbi:MAG: acetyl-CoA carboxylase biotin carboxyl carrier protein [Planctomycetes bacterium]|nr:acetyl-CoA carboxylase biotin carboxyl carrier protein [Planctomycetota bacterium]